MISPSSSIVLTRFPHEPASNHPQYLWNRHEYIIRMLSQNANGIGIDERSQEVVVNLQPESSLNLVANGAADFPNKTQYSDLFTTTITHWIYLRADGAGFFSSNNAPRYNQYLHGHYDDEGNRAVVFINAHLPIGQRAIVMDSFNSLLEYNTRLPTMTPENLYMEFTTRGFFNRRLRAGGYVIQIRGGRGGNGGNVPPIPFAERPFDLPDLWAWGGVGAQATITTFNLILFDSMDLTFRVGGDGAHGQNGRYWWILNGEERHDISQGAGGGASGEDSYISGMGRRIQESESIGGAGAGGGLFVHTPPHFWRWWPWGGTRPPDGHPTWRAGWKMEAVRAGGGGAGSGIAGVGQIANTTIVQGHAVRNAVGGTRHLGGLCSGELIWDEWNVPPPNNGIFQNPIDRGEAYPENERTDNVRRGGNGIFRQIFPQRPPSPHHPSPSVILGGQGVLHATQTQGFIRIWRAQ